MVWAEEDAIVERTCEVVFDLVADVPRMPSWRATLLEAAWADEGPPRKGRPLRAVTRVAGRRFAWEGEVTHWDPPRLFGYLMRGMGRNRHTVQVIFRTEPVADGCRLRMAGGGPVPRGLAGLAMPLITRLLIRENRAALKGLKALAEESHPAGS